MPIENNTHIPIHYIVFGQMKCKTILDVLTLYKPNKLTKSRYTKIAKRNLLAI